MDDSDIHWVKEIEATHALHIAKLEMRVETLEKMNAKLRNGNHQMVEQIRDIWDTLRSYSVGG